MGCLPDVSLDISLDLDLKVAGSLSGLAVLHRCLVVGECFDQ